MKDIGIGIVMFIIALGIVHIEAVQLKTVGDQYIYHVYDGITKVHLFSGPGYCLIRSTNYISFPCRCSTIYILKGNEILVRKLISSKPLTKVTGVLY